MRRFGFILVLAASGLILFSVSHVNAARKGSEVGTRGQTVEMRELAMLRLHAKLSASPRPFQRHEVDLSVDENDILANPGVDATGRLRVGVHRAVGRTVSNRDGDLIVHVPGAPALRLELTKVEGTVAVFNDAGEAHEYNEDGFTHTFSGDEVRVRGAAHVKGVGAVNLAGNLCDFNAACTENAECVSIPAAIEQSRGAYAMLLFFSRGFYYLCSGGLVADSDTTSEIPYFLTANHCVSNKREATSVLTYFDHVRTTCAAGACSFPSQASTSGSTVVATSNTSDYTVLELDQAPPAGSVFLGWNDTPVAFTEGLDLYRISHPGGAPQAYSEHSVDTAVATCGSWPRGSWIYSRDTFGATEGGSSGSPVLNANGEVVGQLTGACGFNVDDECDAINNSTVDGAFAAYYPQVAPFLGGGAGCSADSECDDADLCTTDTCNAGTCSNVAKDCDDGDACTADTCNPGTGTCANDTLSCDDGNACTTDSCDGALGCLNDEIVCPDDGNACTTDACNPSSGTCESTLVDCDDGIACTIDSCDSGTGMCSSDDSQCPVCSESGASCSSDDECCSGKCRGKPADKSCR